MRDCGAPRFQEPRDWDNNVWRIWGHYEVGPVVFQKTRPFEGYVDFEEVDEETCWLDFEVEMLKNCEPEIISVTIETFDKTTKKRVKVSTTGGREVIAEDYLKENHTRWAKMKSWLLEHGERDRVKDREAA